SDTEVIARRGLTIYADRASLAPLPPGEYYGADLVGCVALAEGSDEKLGKMVGLEPAGGADRWWFEIGGKTIAVTATKEFIARVDAASRSIWLRNLDKLK